ncbi:MAG TPA: hypothetical protein VI756_09305 [Blastocatellia bacterium]
MTDTNHPPRVANWLLFFFAKLFVSKDQAPPILGDLREEFSAVASRRGMRSARLWYWRQVAKTVPHLFYSQLVLEPWQVFTAVLAGLVLLTLAYGALYVVQPVRVLAVPRYYFDWPEPLRLAWIAFWGRWGFPIVLYILPSILVGWIVARASKGREMVVTIVFSSTTFLLGMIGVFSLLFYYPHVAPSSWPVWRLFWVRHSYEGPIAAPIGTFIGGLIARKTARALAGPAG